MRKFKNGQRVYWNDPAGETSGEYTILDAHEEKYQNYTDEDIEDYDDRIILIGDGHSEAEVNAEELDILCPLSRRYSRGADDAGGYAGPASGYAQDDA
jgi:hypothetical protein